jgi:hypothetical protein
MVNSLIETRTRVPQLDAWESGVYQEGNLLPRRKSQGHPKTMQVQQKTSVPTSDSQGETPSGADVSSSRQNQK